VVPSLREHFEEQAEGAAGAVQLALDQGDVDQAPAARGAVRQVRASVW
jgi:hypothetical protein